MPSEYADGQIYGWIFWNLRPAASSPVKSQLPKSGVRSADPLPSSNPPPSSTGAAVVLKPPSNRMVVYHADRLGHFSLTAAVNGAPIRFMVDTGASLVALTLDDARAAGFDRSELVFNRMTRTANGPVRYAQVVLREICIEQLLIDDVPAAVMENLDQSLLGMSYLKRLKSFEVREGMLQLGW